MPTTAHKVEILGAGSWTHGEPQRKLYGFFYVVVPPHKNSNVVVNCCLRRIIQIVWSNTIINDELLRRTNRLEYSVRSSCENED